MKPFLKWAGGKYRVLPEILKLLPSGQTLIEPFVGSGAVFLNTDFKNYILADINKDLINLYNCLKNGGKEFINECEAIFIPSNNQEKVFYELREEFNNLSDSNMDKERKSILFIYLNRHCFNGLCRYNKSFKFNVPYGRYKSPYFPREEMINFQEQSKKAKFIHQDFRQTMNITNTKKGDIFYCDPPYVPVSKTASFTSYAQGGFGLEEQEDLVECALQLKKKKISVLISNSDTQWVREHYIEDEYCSIKSFNVRRFISADSAKRNDVGEILALFK